MKKQTPESCPYCKGEEVAKAKNKGLIEISPLEFEEEEEYPMDIWTCSECQRRFVVLDHIEDE